MAAMEVRIASLSGLDIGVGSLTLNGLLSRASHLVNRKQCFHDINLYLKAITPYEKR